MIRQITRALAGAASELRTAAQEVTTTSGQVASSSQLLSQGATSQAASLEETSASMEEMASMTRRNAENSQAAAGQVAETERLVAGANQALSELVASMSTIRDSSSQVTKIIKTIDEIAFQTNILALNAAVEAARAGEAGMGFAVVADEVRNLAQRSAQAAKDTATLIEASAANASSGGDRVDAVVRAMSAITESSARVRGLVEEVSVASRQQAQGIDQVTQAIAQMEKVTQNTAATAEEGAASSAELNAQAEQTTAAVARLEALVGLPPAERASPVPAERRPARTSNVVPITRSAAARPTNAEATIPFEETGTFGSF
jgi:methyl-accepting chemotaxis protein/methyl-accepting chemotaxis protein-1 (serine sensor receptor)